MDCFVAEPVIGPRVRADPLAPRNDERDTRPRSRGTTCPSFAIASPSKSERAQGMPGVGRTRSLACKRKKHASKSPQVRRTIRHSLRDGLRLIARSPWCAGLFSHHRRRNDSHRLDPSVGDQDHAPSPSASACLRLGQAKASIASRLTFRDDWPQRPSGRGGMGEQWHDFRKI